MPDDIFPPRDCKHFSGYKPCFPGEDCTNHCQHPSPFGKRILIVNLDAMGDVLMTTAQLRGIKKQYPESTIYWITLRNAMPLLAHNPFIDQVMEWNDENRMLLRELEFDLVLNADKFKTACAFVRSLRAKEVRGFTLNALGQIVPANETALYNYRLGLDDHLKFHVNEKTGQEILAESWELPFERETYILKLSTEEQEFCESKKKEWGMTDETIAIGLNTGCSDLYPNKKMTIGQHVQLIALLAKIPNVKVLLLGGKEDAERNTSILERVRSFSPIVINTPATEGLRRGLCYMNLAEVVISGDSFGMHAAVGLRKYVLAWFGVTCWAEIDLYDRGRKFYQEDLACSPCWKKVCPYNLECISRINLDRFVDAVLYYKNEIRRKR